MKKGSCRECKHWEQGELVDSGIRAADGDGNWFYHIGKCAKGKLAEPPAWGHCYEFKKGRKR